MRQFGHAMSISVAWSACYVGQLSSASLEGKLLFSRLQLTITIVLPLLCFLVCLRNSRLQHYATKSRILALSIIPALSMVLLWTDSWHHLFAKSAQIEMAESLAILRVEPGPWFWVHAGYSNCLLLAVVLVLSERSRLPWRVGGVPRIVLIGIPLNLAICLGYRLGHLDLGSADPTPLVLNGSLVVLAWATLRAPIIELMPVAREHVVDDMSEAIIVVDALGRIVDVNPAARSLPVGVADDIIAKEAETLLPHAPAWQRLLQEESGASGVIGISQEGATRHYEVTVGPLGGWRGQPTARIISLRDVSDDMRLATEREDLLARLRKAAAQTNALGGLLPICAWCGRVRDDAGYWKSLGQYLTEHSDADIQLGLCPECEAKQQTGDLCQS